MPQLYKVSPHHIFMLYALSNPPGLEDGKKEELPAWLKWNLRAFPYTKEFQKASDEYEKNFLNAQEGSVEIVQGLDDICLLGCNKRKKGCEKSDSLFSYIIGKYLGLVTGKTYNMQELKDKFKTPLPGGESDEDLGYPDVI